MWGDVGTWVSIEGLTQIQVDIAPLTRVALEGFTMMTTICNDCSAASFTSLQIPIAAIRFFSVLRRDECLHDGGATLEFLRYPCMSTFSLRAWEFCASCRQMQQIGCRTCGSSESSLPRLLVMCFPFSMTSMTLGSDMNLKRSFAFWGCSLIPDVNDSGWHGMKIVGSGKNEFN